MDDACLKMPLVAGNRNPLKPPPIKGGRDKAKSTAGLHEFHFLESKKEKADRTQNSYFGFQILQGN